MKCPNCGAENQDNAKFCKSCGKNIQKNHSSNDSNIESKSNKNILIICGTVIICVIIIAGAFLALGNSSNNSVSTDSSSESSINTNSAGSVDNSNRYENFSETEWDQSSYTLDDIYTAHTPEDEKAKMFDKADANGDGVLTGDEIKEMDYLLKHSEYTWNGPGDSSTSNSGISFSEAATYFPEASETVLGHVFDEADGNGDGYLSDSEFELFKKVRDHTKKYAYNLKNDFITDKPSSNEKTGYCADHGRVAVVDGSNCPYCIYMGISDTRTKTSSW